MFEDDNGYDYHNELDDYEATVAEEAYYDELDRDCDEPYEPGNEDAFIDSYYESQYERDYDF